ncbi:MAG: hypothetical protein HKN57_03015 [Xanthomonadales bacterium]|nr:hypothetical protein [Gammaproteobacteria bacterium]MBT8052914.1 hypothetical protein [Gammaproteobacteria bacterium]NND56197.1 hypothetical protein [Xanthomonadales bacterium]NNK51557.1 hypothetical protein [Xanthomonadales bacterium]
MFTTDSRVAWFEYLPSVDQLICAVCRDATAGSWAAVNRGESRFVHPFDG